MNSPKLNWRPHTWAPAIPTHALIAAKLDEDVGMFLVGGVHAWRDGEWVDEATGEPLATEAPFWWLPEDELMKTVQPGWQH